MSPRILLLPLLAFSVFADFGIKKFQKKQEVDTKKEFQGANAKKQFPLYDYPPYEGVCSEYSHGLATVDPAYAEHLKLMDVAPKVPARGGITVFSEVESSITDMTKDSKPVAKAFVAKKKRQGKLGKVNGTHANAANAAKKAMIEKCLSDVALQRDVDFEDVYIASNLLKSCSEGSYMASRKSPAFTCRDSCDRKYPVAQSCAYFHACVSGCVEELKLTTATQNDDLANQVAINPAGVFIVGRDPGWTQPHHLPMIPSPLEYKQTPNSWPPNHEVPGKRQYSIQHH